MRVRFWTCTFFVLISPIVLAHADDAPIMTIGGVATPTGEGNTNSPAIKMLEAKIGIVPGIETYICTASFLFENTGNDVDLDIGFPYSGAGYYDDFKGAVPPINFRAWEGEEQSPTQDISGTMDVRDESTGKVTHYNSLTDIAHLHMEPDAIEQSSFVREWRWKVRKVHFPAHKKVRTRVEYSAPYHELSDCRGVYYIYGSGASWMGPIGKLEISIKLNEHTWPTFDLRDLSLFQQERVSADVVRFSRKNVEPAPDDEFQMCFSNMYPAFEDLGEFCCANTGPDPAMLAILPLKHLEIFREYYFALHGKAFTDPFLQDFFSKRDWYRSNPQFSARKLSKIQRKIVRQIERNLAKIKSMKSTSD